LWGFLFHWYRGHVLCAAAFGDGHALGVEKIRECKGFISVCVCACVCVCTCAAFNDGHALGVEKIRVCKGFISVCACVRVCGVW